MYESFYGFQKKPFSPLPDLKFLYIGEKHRKTLTKLVSGVISRVVITLITGAEGCGKTMLVRYLKNQLEKQITVGVLNNTQLTYGNLMQWILQAFNVKVSDVDEVELHRAFLEFVTGEFAKHRNVLLIVDEAQNLSAQYLEELRLLTNVGTDDRMFQVVLVGQLKLRDMLRHPDMGYLTQRIAVEYQLSPLDLDQTEEYIRCRTKLAGGDPDIFDVQICNLIYSYSKGIPRLINSLCDAALMDGYEKRQKKIDGALIMEIASEQDVAKTRENGMLQPIVLEDANAEKEAKLLPHASSNQVPYGNITVIRDGNLVDNFVINETCMTIGRHQDNDIYLPDKNINQHHARIIKHLGGYYLEDLTTKNGTYVNSQRVLVCALQEGDIVNIGQFKLYYSSSNAYDEHEGITTSYEVTEASPSVRQTPGDQATDAKLVSDDNSASTSQEKTRNSVSGEKEALDQSALPLSDKKSDLDEVLKTLIEWVDEKNFRTNKQGTKGTSISVHDSSSVSSLDNCPILIQKGIEKSGVAK